ncbi:hypothetical protein ID866_8382 [Astraeus odoratus]|nr:hypothetical protein ID866_8382 [Astraeus odoratus]
MTYYAPSDQSGIGGMHHNIIHATPSWHNSPTYYDCVFMNNGGTDKEGFRGLLVARVLLFLAFSYRDSEHTCAFVEWFLPVDEEPVEETGLWIVAPVFNSQGERVHSVIALDTILRGAHLIGVYGDEFLPSSFHYSLSLEAFHTYYVNKYVSHHSHKLAF